MKPIRKTWSIQFVFILILSGYFIQPVTAQCPAGPTTCVGEVIFTQTQVDAFASNNPNCTCISGTLRLINNQTAAQDPITNMDFFQQITGIDNLRVDNWGTDAPTALQDLNALSNVTAIPGFLKIHTNNTLADINGISNITGTVSTIEIGTEGGNLAITCISGFDGLTSVTGNLDIIGETELTNVSGFSNLTNVGGNLTVTANPKLADCCGIFPILNGTVGGTVNISSNAGTCATGTITACGPGAGCPGVPVIPTMGEWALIIFGLMVASFGVISVMRWKRQQQVQAVF